MGDLIIQIGKICDLSVSLSFSTRRNGESAQVHRHNKFRIYTQHKSHDHHHLFRRLQRIAMIAVLMAPTQKFYTATVAYFIADRIRMQCIFNQPTRPERTTDRAEPLFSDSNRQRIKMCVAMGSIGSGIARCNNNRFVNYGNCPLFLFHSIPFECTLIN